MEVGMMNSLIQILEIVSAIGTILCLCLMEKGIKIGRLFIPPSYKYWLLYSFTTVLFVVVMYMKELPFYIVMGVILIFTGLRNYKAGKGKNRNV